MNLNSFSYKCLNVVATFSALILGVSCSHFSGDSLDLELKSGKYVDLAFACSVDGSLSSSTVKTLEFEIVNNEVDEVELKFEWLDSNPKYLKVLTTSELVKFVEMKENENKKNRTTFEKVLGTVGELGLVVAKVATGAATAAAINSALGGKGGQVVGKQPELQYGPKHLLGEAFMMKPAKFAYRKFALNVPKGVKSKFDICIYADRTKCKKMRVELAPNTVLLPDCKLSIAD